jgi:hypothetical protein
MNLAPCFRTQTTNTNENHRHTELFHDVDIQESPLLDK